MNYSQGVDYISNLYKNMTSTDLYSNEVSLNKNFTIKYPGRNNNGDYLLIENGKGSPSYSNIAKRMYNLIIYGRYTFQELKDLLMDIYTNGTDTNYTDPTLKYMQHLIFWKTLKEQVNTTLSKGSHRLELVFSRLFEAIYSSTQESLTIEMVKNRYDNEKMAPPLLFLPDAPEFYNTEGIFQEPKELEISLV